MFLDHDDNKKRILQHDFFYLLFGSAWHDGVETSVITSVINCKFSLLIGLFQVIMVT